MCASIGSNCAYAHGFAALKGMATRMAIVAYDADADFFRRPDGRGRNQEVSTQPVLEDPALTGVQEREEIARDGVVWSLVVFVYSRLARLNRLAFSSIPRKTHAGPIARPAAQFTAAARPAAAATAAATATSESTQCHPPSPASKWPGRHAFGRPAFSAVRMETL